MKKRIIGFIFVLTLLLPAKNVYAAGLGISASTKSVTTGGTVKVTVSASGVAGRVSVNSSNSGVLSGGTSSEWLENESKTYTFTAKNIGSATITVTPINVAYSDGSGKVTGSKSITINVVKPREKSNNNNLKSLSVEGTTLTPEFNKDTLEYNCEVDASVEKIKIDAGLEDSYASLDGIGEKEVVEGANKFEVKVLSETGSEKVYVINVNVKDNNPVYKTIDNKQYSLVKRASSISLPDGLNKDLFTVSNITIDDVEVPAYTSENLSLIGLKDENNNIYLYKVEDNKITSRYEVLTSKSITIVFSDTKEVIDGFKKTVVTINDKEYNCYKNDKYKDYVLIYGTNLETNESNWYLYNIKDNSMQIYMQDMIDSINKECNNKINTYKGIIIALSTLSGLLLLSTILLLTRKNKNSNRNNNIKKEEIKKEEKVEELKPIATQVENKKKVKEKEAESLTDILTQADIDDISDDFLDEREKRKRARRSDRRI